MSNSKNDVTAIMQKAVEGFKSVETKSEVLPVGTHNVRIVKIAILDSFTNLDGTPKDFEEKPPWSIPTPLVAFTYADGERAIVHRNHLLGYLKYEKLTPEQKESGDYEPYREYALDKNGERIPDKENTAAAHRIVSEVFKAAGLKPGSTFDDMDEMVKKGTAEVRIKVTEVTNPETGKAHKEVTKVLPITKEAPVTESFD